MTSTECVVARQRLGLTQEAMAAELGLTPAIIAAWEEGSLAIPSREAKRITWRAAVAERQAALAANGLPECTWILEREREPQSRNTKAALKRVEEVQAHMKACPVCSAREAYLTEHFPPMPPPPVPAWVGAVQWIGAAVARLPRWLQPAANGALLFIAYSLVRLVLMLPRLRAHPEGWLIALAGLAISAGIGAVVGSLYGGWKVLRTQWAARRASSGL